ncbi:hypothetical protein OHA72_49160 [Dactylosporangium sp. NBC_01737]|uniref:hypothetical protein n=1 Tax=Dactylosporangium sp. NBC_01737 TaxID=2975959 RepID=UPI002E0F7E98|nr:hypothetical protein OHA72_49160 [Dactylosporangium sp. NBC_01737]
MLIIAGAEQADGIDVIAVDLKGFPNWHAWSAVPGEVIGTWEGERVATVIGLVAALPRAEMARCFVPRYGIRLRRGSQVLAEAAFCFECSNVLLVPITTGARGSDLSGFDTESRPAQDLLELFRSCTV